MSPLRFKRFERVRAHFAFRFTRLGVVVLATVLAVAIVATLTIDLGPGLRGLAEREGSKRVGPTDAHRQAGRASVQRQVRARGLRDRGAVARRSAVPEGEAHRRLARLGRDAPPRSAARLGRDVRLADGDRAVAGQPPQLSRDSTWAAAGPGDSSRRCQYVRTRNGEVTFEDHGTPWSVVARNLDITVTKSRGIPRRGDVPRWHDHDSGLLADERVDEGHLPRRRRHRAFRSVESDDRRRRVGHHGRCRHRRTGPSRRIR